MTTSTTNELDEYGRALTRFRVKGWEVSAHVETLPAYPQFGTPHERPDEITSLRVHKPGSSPSTDAIGYAVRCQLGYPGIPVWGWTVWSGWEEDFTGSAEEMARRIIDTHRDARSKREKRAEAVADTSAVRLKVSKGGSLFIPKSIRDRINLDTPGQLVAVIEDGNLVLAAAPIDPQQPDE